MRPYIPSPIIVHKIFQFSIYFIHYFDNHFDLIHPQVHTKKRKKKQNKEAKKHNSACFISKISMGISFFHDPIQVKKEKKKKELINQTPKFYEVRWVYISMFFFLVQSLYMYVITVIGLIITWVVDKLTYLAQISTATSSLDNLDQCFRYSRLDLHR